MMNVREGNFLSGFGSGMRTNHKRIVSIKERSWMEREKNASDDMKKNDTNEGHMADRKDSSEEAGSAEMKTMIQMPVKMNLHGMEAKEADHSEANAVAYSGAKEERQKEVKHGLHEGRKENKEEQEAQKENNDKEIAIEDKVQGQSKIKVKKEKSKRKKKKEDQMEWLLSKDDQGRLVLQKLNCKEGRVNV